MICPRCEYKIKLPEPKAEPVPQKPLLLLTPQEFRIAELLPKGLTNEDIGRLIGVKTQVVKNYLHTVFDKTGCRNRIVLAVKLAMGTYEVRIHDKRFTANPERSYSNAA